MQCISAITSAVICIMTVFADTSTGYAANPTDATAAMEKRWEPIAIGAFADSINHALMKYEKGKAPYERYTPDQIVRIAENLLAWQNGDGGWPKNQDWLKVYTPAELAKLPHGKQRKGGDSTLDNRNTWSQVDYLARVHQQSGLNRCAESATRGIEYLLNQQCETGGWRGADVEAITFNDDVMVGVLGELKAIIEQRNLYAFVDDTLCVRVKKAYEHGLSCVLKCQIKVGDRLTAWCQQHDHKTFAPVWARAFEPPSIVSAESVKVVRLLMSIDKPSPDIVRAVQAAVSWFDRVKIKGLRVDKIPDRSVTFPNHSNDFDLVEVKDPAAPPIWTRFYDLKTEKSIFCTRERNITENYADLGRERRTGYSWYGYWPAKLLDKEYPTWQQKWAPHENVLRNPRN